MALSSPIKGEIAAVVTTFSPDETLSSNLLLISHQVALVVLIDDTGIGGENADYAIRNLIVIKNSSNYGIAKSLNIGINYAAERGFEWIITLDDDTRVDEDYVSTISRFLGSTTLTNIGIIALSRPVPSFAAKAAQGNYSIRRNIITSGSFFSVDIFRSIGGFSEDLFIDLVDFDFCCRIRKAGYTPVTLSNIGMQHRVGASENRRFLFLNTTVYNHSPFRLYYQIRNAIVFFGRHFSYDFLLCSYIILDVLRIPAKAVLFEADKTLRLKFVWRGLRDAVLGRLGRIE